jgi:hypothetical protein
MLLFGFRAGGISGRTITRVPRRQVRDALTARGRVRVEAINFDRQFKEASIRTKLFTAAAEPLP